MDWFLLSVALLVSLVGLVEIYSTTENQAHFAGMHWRQLTWIGIGLLVMLVVARIDYHWLLDQSVWIYLGTLALLAAVFFVGTVKFGARRWIEIGGQTFQVSELAKWSIIIVLAKYFGDLRSDTLTLKDMAKVAVLAGVPLAMIAAQPDLGTALTLVPIAAVGVGNSADAGSYRRGRGFSGRLALEAHGRLCPGGGAVDAGRLVPAEAVPAGTPGDICQPRARHPRPRLPDPAVKDRRRVRWVLGQGHG
jgi:hypothetical protein